MQGDNLTKKNKAKDMSKIMKVVINVGIGEAISDKKVIGTASSDLMTITGQKPKVAQAKISVSSFKTRKGDPIGLVVTLRGKRMSDFLKKLVAIVLPRLRDFQGVPTNSFDGHGNYSLGISEQIVFPEIDYTKIDKVRGLQITIVTNTGSDEKAKKLLGEIGMPFAKESKDGKEIKNY